MKDEEKRERICRELSGKESLEFGKLQERTGIPDYTLRYLLGEMTREGRVERCGYQSGRKLYRLVKPENHRVCETERTGGIGPKELEKVKRWAKPGQTVRIWNPSGTLDDETGKIEKTKIKAVYPHLVVFENGQSATWAQIAMYHRNKRGYIC